MKRVDFLDLKGNGNFSKELFRIFLKNGTMFAVQTSLEQAGDALLELHTYARDNFCILYDDLNELRSSSHVKLIPYHKGQLWNCIREKPNSCHVTDDAVSVTFVLFTATMDSTQTVLPPTQVFLDISTDSRYTPYGFILYEDRYIFSYVPRKHLKGNRVKLILGNSGSSSTVLSYPIIRHMVETFEQQGAQCDFYYNYSSKSFAIYPYVFPNRTHILFHPDAKIYPVMHLLKKEIHTIGQYGDVRHMILTQNNFISKETEGHIVKEMMAMAGYERKLNVYEQFLLTPEKAKDQHTTSPYLINAIQQQCLRYRYIIGVQFESISDFEHIHDQDSIIKKWPSSSAEKFIHLCKAQGICICSLSRLNRDYDNVIGVGHLSIGELFGLIRHLDLVLGVDSICCYIASILRIPNISIWRYTLPYVDQTPNGGANLSLRPPCANHSIIIQDGDIAGIDPNRFLNAVLHLLANPETVLSRPFENPLPHEEW